MITYDYIPDEVISLITNRLGPDDAPVVLTELNKSVMLESVVPPLVGEGRTYGDWNSPLLNLRGVGDYRPTDALPLDVINQMLRSAPVRFALEMKRSQIVSVFRNERSWKIHSPDAELAEVVTANMKKVLPKMALDFSFSSLAYGTSFQELIWEFKNKYELGLTDSKYQGNKKFAVARVPNSVNPMTVLYIKRTENGHFNGFVQQSRVNGVIQQPVMGGHFGPEIDVDVDSALIIPYDEKFRNLWGESMLRPMYPIWFWYEIVLRAMVKYMERMGTPVTVVKAPSRATVIKPGTKTKVDGITWGMEIGTNLTRSSVAVLPSDTDDAGKPLWDISYLSAAEKSQPFLDILELLTQMILRAGLSADRALTQSSGGVGSYAIGEVHQQATSLHNELILTQWVHYLNTYFLPHYSLYNRGTNGPPIWMETQGLDPTDRDNLVTLLGAAQGMPGFQELGDSIDWDTILSNNSIPTLTPEQAEAKRTKREEDNLKKQEDMLATQARFETPSPTKQDDGSLKANLPNKPAQEKDASK
jgi:hypothetical protein